MRYTWNTMAIVAALAAVTMLFISHNTSAASFISTGDGGWEYLDPRLGTLSAVHFADDKTGWVVGGDCMIMKTTDGGTNWAPQGQRIRKVLKDVCFTDKDHGWTVGTGYANLEDKTGIIFKTTDSGATWRKVLDGKTDGLLAVSFVNNNVGWAVGASAEGASKGIILKTIDGGETWFEQDCGVQLQAQDSRWFDDVSFVDENTGYVLCNVNGNTHILSTADGGRTWGQQEVKRTRPERLQFLDVNTGWILTKGIILRTTDGGRTWTETDLYKLCPPDREYPARRYPSSFHFYNSQNGVAASGSGNLLRTRDGGKTWALATHSSGERFPYPKVQMIDSENGWAAGAGGVMRTSDSGPIWEACFVQESLDLLRGICFISPKVGWTVGRGGVVLKTEDGGLTWSRYPVEQSADLNVVFFLDQEVGWATTKEGLVLKTTDGGAAWQPHHTGVKKWLGGIHFVDALHGWAVGVEGTIIRTSDGGSTWTRLDSGTMDHLSRVYFADEKTGWVCGQNGRIMKTTDGGMTWKRKGSGTVGQLDGMHFISETTGWLCGSKGLILKTTDGGETWTPQDSGTEGWLMSIRFINESEGWAAGAYDIIHTTDGGQTWTAQAGSGLCIHFNDANNGWTGYGGILRTTTGGLPGAVWAKKQADGSDANFGHLVVTKRSEGYLLAEHPDSRIGIRVNTTDAKPNVGDYIYIHGKIAFENGEKLIAADSIDIMCAGWGVLPER